MLAYLHEVMRVVIKITVAGQMVSSETHIIPDSQDVTSLERGNNSPTSYLMTNDSQLRISYPDTRQ